MRCFLQPILCGRLPNQARDALATMAGTDPAQIVTEIFSLLGDKAAYSAMSRAHNPLGDGKAAQRIARVIADAG